MIPWLTSGLLLAALGGFLLWTGQHSVHPGVRPDRSPGIRVPATTESREAWLAAHRPARPYFLASGTLTLVAGALFPAWGAFATAPGDATAPTLAVVAVTALIVLLGGAVGLRALARRSPAEPLGGSGRA
ncbi:SdpI family protein [Nocardiopsis halotolerans]|uniref:SdpI family protein n=1 Tax=Nocardiopsis halotolerans TaxID=124252 RepID=UPI0003498B88|nr:SdpI family protein [Nocardiopsis halotolerans]